MKSRSLLFKIAIIVLLFLVLGDISLLAQPLPPASQGSVLGGAGILLLLGLFFWIRKYMRNNKK